MLVITLSVLECGFVLLSPKIIEANMFDNVSLVVQIKPTLTGKFGAYFAIPSGAAVGLVYGESYVANGCTYDFNRTTGKSANHFILFISFTILKERTHAMLFLVLYVLNGTFFTNQISNEFCSPGFSFFSFAKISN